MTRSERLEGLRVGRGRVGAGRLKGWGEGWRGRGEGWRGWTGRNGSLKKRSEGWGDGLGTEGWRVGSAMLALLFVIGSVRYRYLGLTMPCGSI